MESVGSSSSPPHPLRLFRPTQPVADRILRALRQGLRLLHRLDSSFFILGATGNVYTVTLSATPSCTCPDRSIPCKHILFVYIRVLGVSLDDNCLRRRTLRPCQLHRLLAIPTLHESLAGEGVRQRFHQLFFQSTRHSTQGGSSLSSSWPIVHDIEEGTTCPVCLDEMAKGESLLACRTCRNLIHEECLTRWKKSQGRRPASCVICRAKWKDHRTDQQYLNLVAYVNRG